jgi:hypothetical protein
MSDLKLAVHHQKVYPRKFFVFRVARSPEWFLGETLVEVLRV